MTVVIPFSMLSFAYRNFDVYFVLSQAFVFYTVPVFFFFLAYLAHSFKIFLIFEGKAITFSLAISPILIIVSATSVRGRPPYSLISFAFSLSLLLNRIRNRSLASVAGLGGRVPLSFNCFAFFLSLYWRRNIVLFFTVLFFTNSLGLCLAYIFLPLSSLRIFDPFSFPFACLRVFSPLSVRISFNFGRFSTFLSPFSSLGILDQGAFPFACLRVFGPFITLLRFLEFRLHFIRLVRAFLGGLVPFFTIGFAFILKLLFLLITVAVVLRDGRRLFSAFLCRGVPCFSVSFAFSLFIFTFAVTAFVAVRFHDLAFLASAYLFEGVPCFTIGFAFSLSLRVFIFAFTAALLVSAFLGGLVPCFSISFAFSLSLRVLIFAVAAFVAVVDFRLDGIRLLIFAFTVAFTAAAFAAIAAVQTLFFLDPVACLWVLLPRASGLSSTSCLGLGRQSLSFC